MSITFLDGYNEYPVVEIPAYTSAEPICIDIYANTQTDIQNTKTVLMRRLTEAKKCIRWSVDHRGTVGLVQKLSHSQVGLYNK